MKIRFLGIFFVAGLIAAPASAGPIAVDTWYEFSFGAPGTGANGCFPDDPAGDFCLPSSGTPTIFADAPAWTFTAGAAGATFTVTDAFASGDTFEILDFGVPQGFTSAFVPNEDCGDDPVPCLADPNMSHRVYALAAGNHSITIAVGDGGFGAAYFLLQGDAGNGQPVPEPATLGLVAVGIATTIRRRVRRGVAR